MEGQSRCNSHPNMHRITTKVAKTTATNKDKLSLMESSNQPEDVLNLLRPTPNNPLATLHKVEEWIPSTEAFPTLDSKPTLDPMVAR